MKALALLACTLAWTAAAPRRVPAQSPYRVLDHWVVGGMGGWDYLVADGKAHRLYVTHNTRVEILDTTTGKTLGAITGLQGTHGVALDEDGHFGYISDGGGDAVIVFDRRTLTRVASIAAGSNPDGIVFEPVTRTVWAFNGHSNSVTVIDTRTRTVAATIPLPGKPEFPQADGHGRVFDNLEDRNSLVVLDAKHRSVVTTWPMPGCESPSGLAMDRQGGRLFSVCRSGRMVVTDAHDGRQLGFVPIGEGPDAAGYDAIHRLAFASTGIDGALTVANTRVPYATLETLPTQKGARTLAYDATTDRIFVATADEAPPPAPAPDNPRPRPQYIPGTFQILVIGRR